MIPMATRPWLAKNVMARALLSLIQILLLVVQPRVCTCAPAPQRSPTGLAGGGPTGIRETGRCCGRHAAPGAARSDRAKPTPPGPCCRDGCGTPPDRGRHACSCLVTQPPAEFERGHPPFKASVTGLSLTPVATLGGDQTRLTPSAARAGEGPAESSRPLFLRLHTLLI